MDLTSLLSSGGIIGVLLLLGVIWFLFQFLS